MKILKLFKLILILISYISLNVLIASASEETFTFAQEAAAQKKIMEMKLRIKSMDSQMSNLSNNIRLFARLSDPDKSEKEGYPVPSSKIVSVPNPDKWPEDTVESYLILLKDDGSVLAFEGTPASESGDWSITYTHYFDSKGNTIAFKRYSGFFMGCPAEVSKETSVYFFDEKNRLIQKEYALVDGDGKKIDPKECEFMYRHDYKIHKSWDALGNDIGIINALSSVLQKGGR